jgi:hypothetical protein
MLSMPGSAAVAAVEAKPADADCRLESNAEPERRRPGLRLALSLPAGVV